MSGIIGIIFMAIIFNSIAGAGICYSQSKQTFPSSADVKQENVAGNDSLVPGSESVYLGPIRPNAYGPGINADATGRPFQWQPDGMAGQSVPDPTLNVTPNAYGMGVHTDQYGRIVKPVCPFGQSTC